jgi:hypothetical protein
LSNIRSRIESALPSRSNPSTPRDSDSDASISVAAASSVGRFAQHKPKVVNRRYIRSSPPRDTGPSPQPTLAQQQPEQTRTGLILTKPFRDRDSPQFGSVLRCSSTTDLVLPLNSGGASGTPMSGDRSRSASSSSLHIAGKRPPPGIFSARRPDFSHVESKVRNYIHSVKSMSEDRQASSMQKSKSCGNLSPFRLARERRNSLTESVPEPPQTTELKKRPQTAPSDVGVTKHEDRQSSSPGQGESKEFDGNDEGESRVYDIRYEEAGGARRTISQAHSKSDPNLSVMQMRFAAPPPSATARGLSKSAVSLAGLGKLGDLIDSEDSDYEAKARFFSRDNLNDVYIESEDLLHLGRSLLVFAPVPYLVRQMG